MKAPTQSAVRRKSRRVGAHSARIYRAHREATPSGWRSLDLLAARLGYPRAVLLGLVGAEASRLAAANRRKVVTRWEVDAAVALVRRRVGTRAAA